MYDVVVKKFTFAISSPDEFLFCARVARRSSEQLPQPCQTVERVDKLTALGITINARLTATDNKDEISEMVAELFNKVHIQTFFAHWICLLGYTSSFRFCIETQSNSTNHMNLD